MCDKQAAYQRDLTQEGGSGVDAMEKRMDAFTIDPSKNGEQSTQWGQKVNDEESLKAGARGPTLMEDFTMREKIMHFDHER